MFDASLICYNFTERRGPACTCNRPVPAYTPTMFNLSRIGFPCSFGGFGIQGVLSCQVLSVMALTGVCAGAIAAVAGFGIGTILTPLMALKTGVKVAVAAATIPHFVGTALRFWMLRRHVDRDMLKSFGLMSAAGGLAGALLHDVAGNVLLTALLGGLMIVAGAAGLTGLAGRLRFRGSAAWLAGAFSGLLGGLVGEQGEIRSAAMLGLGLSKEAFVATATAVALMVDGARLPVYLATEGRAVAAVWPLPAVATAGVIVGTLAGERWLRRIPEKVFKGIVSALILALGVAILYLTLTPAATLPFPASPR